MKNRGRTAIVAILVAALATLAGSCHRPPRFGCDFEQDNALDLLEWSCRTLFRVSPDHATLGSRSLEISFFPAPEGQTENYPGISFSKFDPDWTRSRKLVFDVYNPESDAIRLALRIDDRQNPDYADRLNRSLPIPPGMNRVSLPLDELATSGTKRALDLHGIRTVILFISNPRERHVLYLDRIVLE